MPDWTQLASTHELCFQVAAQGDLSDACGITTLIPECCVHSMFDLADEAWL